MSMRNSYICLKEMETSYHIWKTEVDFHIWKFGRAAQESLLLISSMVLSRVAS